MKTALKADKRSARVDLLWPALAAVMWGGSTVAGRIAVTDFSALTATTLRFGAAAVFLIPMLLYYRRTAPRLTTRDFVLCLALGLVGVVAFNMLVYSGLKFTTASEAAIITAATPAITVVLAALFLGERMTVWTMGGAIISLLGVTLVVWNGFAAAGMDAQRLLGDGLIIGSMLAWALYNILTRVSLANLSPTIVAIYSSLLGFVFLMPFGIWEVGQAGGVSASWPSWTAIVYAAVFATIIGTILWNIGIQRTGVGKVSVLGNLTPVSTLLIAAVLLGEPLGVEHLLGIGLVLFGVWLTNRSAPVIEPQQPTG